MTKSRSSALALSLLVVASAPAAARQAPTASDPCAVATPFTTGGMPGIIRVAAPRVMLRLAVADTEPARERGLMCITSLAHGEGMIFAFPGAADANRSFWMKNTLVPLDMVWVSRSGRITAIAVRVPATTVTTPDEAIPTRQGTGRYVIELGAGEATRDGLAVGAMLHITSIRGS